jgi:GNAT superfamily N-acetyltransferase
MSLWVAEEGAKPFIAGGARYIVIKPGRAEVAFAVVDQFQGQGIGSALLRHLSSLVQNRLKERSAWWRGKTMLEFQVA